MPSSRIARRWLDARHLLAGLTLVVAALALLAYWAWQASVRRHEVALQLLRSHAELAAQRLGARMLNELYLGGAAIFRPVTGGRLGAAVSSPEPEALLDAARTAEACRCVPVLRPVFALRTDLTVEGTRFASADTGMSASGAELARPNPPLPSAETRAAIISAMREQLARMPTGWDLAVLHGSAAQGGRVMLFSRVTGPVTPTYVAFASDSATIREFVVRPVFCNTRLVATCFAVAVA